MEFFLKNDRFSGQIWPDWGYTAWVHMTGLGSIGFKRQGISMAQTVDWFGLLALCRLHLPQK